MDGGRSERDGSASLYTAGRRTGSSPRAPPAKGGGGPTAALRGAPTWCEGVPGPLVLSSRARRPAGRENSGTRAGTTDSTPPPFARVPPTRRAGADESTQVRSPVRLARPPANGRAPNTRPLEACSVCFPSLFFSVAMSHRSPCRERDGETVPAFDSPLCPSDRR